jgi:hypothetical protein
MNDALDRLAAELRLADDSQEALRFAFGHACVMRVRHLLEDAQVLQCLDGLTAFLDGHLPRAQLDALAQQAAQLANRHPGSKSIDGCGHAAVSATYAVAKALAGQAREAAEYAAYAGVYAQGGSAAVADRESFATEFAWQVRCLTGLAEQQAACAKAPWCS